MQERKTYKHIDRTERKEIKLFLGKGYSVRDMARALKRSPSSISEELKVNSINGIYDPEKADHKAYVRRKYSKYQGMKVREDDELRKYVEEKTKEEWSPEIIAGRLKNIDTRFKYAGKGAIYKYIYSVYGQELKRFLYHKRVFKKSGPKKGRNKKIDNRVFIDKRPKDLEKREYFGDWEGDFVVSGKNGKGVLMVLEERKSRYVLLRKLLSRDNEIINRTIPEMTASLTNFNSLTIDNDISFRKHQELSRLLKAPIYFCHPYHSWEKGGVENVNKWIRIYVHKKSDISKYSNEYIKMIEDKLNHKPRKCLNFKTPYEIMLENNQFKYLNYDLLKTKNTTSSMVLLSAGCSA